MPRLTAEKRAPSGRRKAAAKTARPARKATRRRGTSKLARANRLRVVRRILLATPTLALVLLLAWAFGTGWARERWSETQEWMVEQSASAGLAATDIQAVGRNRVHPHLIMSALEIQHGDPLIALDPHRARERLIALPWVREAWVARNWPNQIVVTLEEREPFAIWQIEQNFVLIDREGVQLTAHRLGLYGDLPQVVGPGANTASAAFLPILESEPLLAAITDAAVYVGERRWNLQLSNGITILLPEDGVAGALSRVADAERETGLFTRDIVAVDARLTDRLIVEVSDVARQQMTAPEEST